MLSIYQTIRSTPCPAVQRRAAPTSSESISQSMRLNTIVACLMLAGCAAQAPQASMDASRINPVEIPGNWSATTIAAKTDASSLAQWWLRFDDPLLTTLVTQSMQANSDVQGAQGALRQARALRDVSAAALLPTGAGSASAQRSKSGNNNAIQSYSAALDASWEADFFGANRSALAASAATAQASAANLGHVQVSIAAEVALNYIALRAAQARLMIARDNLSSQQETLQITLWRLQAGLITSLEAEQARTATEQTRAQLPVLQTTIEQSSHALAVLCGAQPAALSGILATVGPVPQARVDLALSFPAQTLRQRPDVRAAEYQVTAALGRVAQADAARMPSFNLKGSLGLDALTLGTLTNGASVFKTLLAGVAVPVFDGGALRAQVRAQQGALDQAGALYQGTLLVALKEVEDALVALRGDRERLLRLQNAAEAAGNAALMASQRYSSGLVDFQIVLETQRTQLSTQDNVASAGANLGADHVRLYKALGGGWRPDGDPATMPWK
jgi:NodT family efflux transporter outer membrane factor (OMF) lipoprotein